MKLIGSLCLCALALAGCASPARSSPGPPLQGIVYDSGGTALGAVEIRVSPANAGSVPTATVRSGIDGRFSLPGSHRGPLMIEASRPGYEPSTSTVTVTDSTQILYLRLRSAADVLEVSGSALVSGRLEAARRAALEAIGVAPNDPAVRFEAAAILVRAGDPEAAWEVLDWFPADAVPEALTLLRDRITETGAAK